MENDPILNIASSVLLQPFFARRSCVLGCCLLHDPFYVKLLFTEYLDIFLLNLFVQLQIHSFIKAQIMILPPPCFTDEIRFLCLNAVWLSSHICNISHLSQIVLLWSQNILSVAFCLNNIKVGQPS